MQFLYLLNCMKSLIENCMISSFCQPGKLIATGVGEGKLIATGANQGKLVATAAIEGELTATSDNEGTLTATEVKLIPTSAIEEKNNRD